MRKDADMVVGVRSTGDRDGNRRIGWISQDGISIAEEMRRIKEVEFPLFEEKEAFRQNSGTQISLILLKMRKNAGFHGWLCD